MSGVVAHLERVTFNLVGDEEEEQEVAVGPQVQVGLSTVQGHVEQDDDDAPEL